MFLMSMVSADTGSRPFGSDPKLDTFSPYETDVLDQGTPSNCHSSRAIGPGIGQKSEIRSQASGAGDRSPLRVLSPLSVSPSPVSPMLVAMLGVGIGEWRAGEPGVVIQ
jgi:hypothetical protein